VGDYFYDKDGNLLGTSEQVINKLEKENKELKTQLSNVKYLGRGEVQKKFDNAEFEISHDLETEEYEWCIKEKDIDELITTICKLALPTKDKIIEVLDKHYNFIDDETGEYNEFNHKKHDGYADEILQEDNQ